MTKTVAKSGSSPANRFDLDSWLLGADTLEPDAVALLTAYRTAAETARQMQQATAAASQAVEPNEGSEPSNGESPAVFVSRSLPPVARLRSVEGIEAERLASLHGRLLAAGYLTAEVLGRSDGLAYLVTREGLRLLNGEAVTAEAATEAA